MSLLKAAVTWREGDSSGHLELPEVEKSFWRLLRIHALVP